MRIGWHIPLPGPFSVGGTLWRSKSRRRGPVYHGRLPGWKCPHNHSRPDLAEACAEREARRRGIAQTATATPRQEGKAYAQVQRTVTAGKAASAEWRAMLTAQAAGDSSMAQAHCIRASAALQTAIAELDTLIRQNPDNAAIPGLTKGLETLISAMEETNGDVPAQDEQETAQ
jgi:hypothetical protein